MDRTKRRKKDTKPQRKAVRALLGEKDIKLLEKRSRAQYWHRGTYAGVLLENALHATWAYGYGSDRDVKAVTTAYDFFARLYHLQKDAMKEVERAGIAAKNAALEAGKLCRWWIDAEKVHRADSADEEKAPAKRTVARKAATS